MVFALPYTTLLWMLLNIMRTKRKSLFGWSNVFYNYSLQDFAKDAWMPFLIALVLLAVAMLNNTDMYVQVGKILDLGISIIPSMVALIVAAFCSGVLMTTLVYHAFINGIMNNYLHRTIRIMARTEIEEARKEADMILQNANIKADAILQGTNNYVLEKKTKGDE